MRTTKVIKTNEAPSGLIYVPAFLTEAEHREYFATLSTLEYANYIYQGYTAKRKVVYYGFGYEFYTKYVHERDPFPDWLLALQSRAAPHANLQPNDLNQALIAEYEPGAAIGWHRDAPAFGHSVVGISFGSEETMRFRRQVEGGFEMYKLSLAPGSLYVISNAARSHWQHSLAPAKDLRYSITFRMVHDKYKSKELP